MRVSRWTHLSAAFLLCGCGLLGGGKGGREDEPRPAPILTLHVENQNFYDATLFALARSGEQQRLGIVTGNSQGTFTFRWTQDELRVIIRLLAGGSTATEPILVNPGDSLNLIITPDLHFKIPAEY
jgi:hypothetical protein